MMFTSVKNGSVFKLLKSIFGGNTSDTDPIITIRASYCGIPFVPIPSMQPTDVQVDSTTASAVMAHYSRSLMRFRHRASRKKNNRCTNEMDAWACRKSIKDFKLPNISILHTRLNPSFPHFHCWRPGRQSQWDQRLLSSLWSRPAGSRPLDPTIL